MDAELSARGEAIDDFELEIFLEDVFRLYHYDFRSYARSSIKRRIAHAQASLGSASLAELRKRLKEDPEIFAKLLSVLTVQVSAFFRDPPYWALLRERVLPYLSTYPFLRFWVAGCGQGEEAYSLAILLHEEGLLERSRIYATDINVDGLEVAKQGIYEAERLKELSSNYFASGGKSSPSDYYRAAKYSMASVAPFLKRRILFSDHSLATDSAFAEVQLASCRNVLIYFNKSLQDRAIGVLADSLCPGGFLGLGSHESLQFSVSEGSFEVVSRKDRIYRKKVISQAPRMSA